MLGDLVTGYVGSHDEDGVLAVDGLPLAICQAALARVRNGNVRKLAAGQAPSDSCFSVLYAVASHSKLSGHGTHIRTTTVSLTDAST